MDYINTLGNSQPALDFDIPPSFLAFLSDEDFEYLAATKQVSEEAIDWSDLPVNTVFRVQNLVPIQTKWGSRCILELRSRDGNIVKVWSPTNVTKDHKSGMKLNNTQDAYIKSLGQKETKTITGSKKRYYDFETVYI